MIEVKPEQQEGLPTRIPRFAPVLSNTDAASHAGILKALASPVRLHIIRLLVRHEDDICVFEIANTLGMEQPTISHHLRILREAGLVGVREAGCWGYYYVCKENLAHVHAIIDGLTEGCNG
jgi:ArsR family transcriptional regulator